jgi:hypothetical protein
LKDLIDPLLGDQLPTECRQPLILIEPARGIEATETIRIEIDHHHRALPEGGPTATVTAKVTGRRAMNLRNISVLVKVTNGLEAEAEVGISRPSSVDGPTEK